MRKLVIVAYGDNDELHEKALAAAVEAVEKVNHAPVHRAWLEEGPSPFAALHEAMQRSVGRAARVVRGAGI